MGRAIGLEHRERATCVLRLSALTLGSTAMGAAAAAQVIRFSEPVLYTETGGAGQLLTADLDSDAHVDVIVTGGNAVNVLFNDGAGGLAAETRISYERSLSHLRASDLDGDLHVDLVWFERLDDGTRALSVWYNSGDGRSGELQRVPVSEYSGVPAAIWDVNGDGLDDVLFSAGGRSLDALVNQGDRTFVPLQIFEYHVSRYSLQTFVPGDFDGDGDADVAAMFQYFYSNRYTYVKGTVVSLLINDRALPFRLGSEVGLEWTDDDIAGCASVTGDFDGDGDLDVMISGRPLRGLTPSAFVSLENLGGRFALIETYRAADGAPNAVSVADINTDGRLDVAFATDAIRGVYVRQNLGGFSFGGMSPFPTSIRGALLSTADLDGDGQFDLVQAGSGGIAVLFNETDLVGPRLGISELRRDQVATFLVEGARPDETVYFLHSPEGVGRSRGRQELGGLVVDLSPPTILMASARANENGVAICRRRIPANARLGPVTFQAVIRRGPGGVHSVKTPFRTVLLQD